MTANPWEREAENWLRWARTPDHDSYWAYRQAFFTDIVPAPRGLTLDVGCGEGRVARELRERGHDVIGVDLTFTLLREAKRATPGLRAAGADARTLPFGDATFDTVIAHHLLYMKDMPAVVAECSRVLRKGGQFCVCVVHPLHDGGYFLDNDPDGPFVVRHDYYEPLFLSERFERDGLEITFEGWTFPLEDHVRAVEAAGLVIERIREPKPDPSFFESHPTWRKSARIPMMLTYRALKR